MNLTHITGHEPSLLSRHSRDGCWSQRVRLALMCVDKTEVLVVLYQWVEMEISVIWHFPTVLIHICWPLQLHYCLNQAERNLLPASQTRENSVRLHELWGKISSCTAPATWEELLQRLANHASDTGRISFSSIECMKMQSTLICKITATFILYTPQPCCGNFAF